MTVQMRPWWTSLQRYGLSLTGPILVSGGHFFTSLIVLRSLPPAAFGLFSFLLVVVPFALSLVAALLSAPAAQTRGMDEDESARTIGILQKISLAVSAAATIGVLVLMAGAGASLAAAVCFGLYGGLFAMRGFARALHNVQADYLKVAASDICYALVLAGGMTILVLSHRLAIESGAFVFAAAAACALLPFGGGYFRSLFGNAAAIQFSAYRPIWQRIGRWSLAGVVLTEATINAHAYFVTFLAGPHAFGLLAVGALFMRPAALVQSALPEIDMPLINKHLAAKDVAGAQARVREFRIIALTALGAAMLLAVAIMLWFPDFVLKKGYAHNDVLMVLGLWACITFLRAVRTPTAVFLQAANCYPLLARISLIAGLVSSLSTLGLLLVFGPVASLGGLVLGEVVTVLILFPAAKGARIAHA